MMRYLKNRGLLIVSKGLPRGEGGEPAPEPKTESVPAPNPEPEPKPKPLDSGSFAQLKLEEGGNKVLKSTLTALGLTDQVQLNGKDIVSDTLLVTSFLKERLDSKKTVEVGAEALKAELTGQINEGKSQLTTANETITGLKNRNGLLQGILDNGLTLQKNGLKFLEFTFNDTYNVNEDGHIYQGKKPMMSGTEYSTFGDIVKEMALTPGFFEEKSTVSGSGVTGGDLTDDQVKAKVGSKEWLAKCQASGHWAEFQKSFTPEDLRKVIAKVPE